MSNENKQPTQRAAQVGVIVKDLIETLMIWNGQASAGLDVNFLAGLRDELTVILAAPTPTVAADAAAPSETCAHDYVRSDNVCTECGEKAAQPDERAALPRYTEWLHLRTHGEWSNGVPTWARDHSGRMNDMTAAASVIEELAAHAAAPQAALTTEQREAIEWAAGRAHVMSLGKPVDGSEFRRWRVLSNLVSEECICEGSCSAEAAGYACPNEAADFQWPALPSYPESFAHVAAHAYFTEHQMQGYANAYGEIVRASLATAPTERMSDAARDVLAERARQVSVEGWTPEHDDKYTNGELPRAAACYAHAAGSWMEIRRSMPAEWPWARDWWKPGTPRRMLEKAAAMIISEMERIDRAARKAEIERSGSAGGEA
ncbi:hypothetical protein [Paraburkholderia sp. Ac-20347]|uniref:hypothetical protein n=1 Tax=Paraburkholderia sp. Ac-20347 TaxID=2703892 RepID=UPI00197D4EF1|nr:hypothetical protein [Paraburkholderia sp. Ac-20347]MBN3811664.1 hypothetical protein [Paraburkholderia sp. Ac-20347]